METKRLGPGDGDLARRAFAVMAEAFEEPNAELGDAYLERLLKQEGFWALVALDGEEVVGGITAHALPMTRSETTELFIYDLAVRKERQRQGIGRALVTALREAGCDAGIDVAFVPADDEDTHALDFYRALGGHPAPVTIFDWQGRPAAREPP